MFTKILIVLLLIIIGIFTYQQYFNTAATPNLSTPIIIEGNTETIVTTPELSPDGKSITINDSTVLHIEDETILSYFKNQSTGLCDEYNIHNTPTRTSFCTDAEAFADSVSFTKIAPSATGGKIGFVIASKELAPDTAVGIFYPQNTTYKVHLLTNYYLGNDFIGFSPDDSYFVTKDSCFEGICGFSIYNAATRSKIRHFGNPESEPANTFLRWETNDSFTYSVGAETRTFTIE